MRKIYVIDTSVLVYDPNSIKEFKDHDVVIPIIVLDELDKLKKGSGAVSKNARVFIRALDALSETGEIHNGIALDHNSTLKIDVSAQAAIGTDPEYGDNQILATAKAIKDRNKKIPVILVSRDINLRTRARAYGLLAQNYEKDKLESVELFSGFQNIINEDAGNQLLEDGFFENGEFDIDILPNECIALQEQSGDGIALGRRVGTKIKAIQRQDPWGISGRNKEQAFAINLLLDPNVPLVSMIGKAGSGKTLIAVASALEATLEKRKYDKIIIYRPIQPVGNDIGYLPGPQPLDAKILTPDGWSTMGEIKIGDKIIAKDGMPTEILGIYPKGTKSVFKVTTSDGTSTECCEDHLWYTETAENKKIGSVKTTKEIMKTLNKNNKVNHFLPRNDAVHYNESKLPLPAYTLGVILGDGSISNNIASMDKELTDRVDAELKELNCSLSENNNSILFSIKSSLYNNKPARLVKITNLKTNEVNIYNSVGMASSAIGVPSGTIGNRCQNNRIINDEEKYEFLECPNRWQNPVKNILHDLGLEGTYSYNKFIPKQYLYASIPDRIALLQGLMDTDGTIKKNGEASYCTTSIKLALNLIEIVRSLGGRATLCRRNRIEKETILNNRKIITKRESFEFTVSLPANINPFFISRKANRHQTSYIHRVGIKSIEYVGEKPVQCILVDNPEHLYLTDDFIVTHNTMDEKLEPWMGAIMDSMEFCFSQKSKDRWRIAFDMYREKGMIELQAITYIRGRSIPNAFIIIDECQNLSKDEVKTILTRAGYGTKIVLTGDIEQIDNSHLDATNNGLTYIVEKFKNSKLAGHVTFTRGERSELASEAAEIL